MPTGSTPARSRRALRDVNLFDRVQRLHVVAWVGIFVVAGFILGAWLFISAWLWSHTAAQATNAWVVGLACAAGTFGLAFDTTWHQSQRDQAALSVGTDLALTLSTAVGACALAGFLCWFDEETRARRHARSAA